jgi:sulfopyruvate decarboxylase TPP-binding subunit
MTPPRAPAFPPLSADELLELLESEGVTHVVGLPDNDTAPLLDMLADHPRVRLVRVAREGEAFALAAGLWVGGATPVVVIQNTGLLEAGDALRGTASRMGVPLVMLIGYRGFAKMSVAGRVPGELAALPGAGGGPRGLSRNDLVAPSSTRSR